MKLDIRSLGFALTEGLRVHLEHSLRAAFRHGRAELVEVQARLTDLNGPRGGVDKRCLLRARYVGGEHAVVIRRDRDLYVAIAQAAEILGERDDSRRQKARRGRRGSPD